MTLPRSLDDYGGVKVNAKPIEVPTHEKSAEEDNRQATDVAHMTRTSPKAWVTFSPTATAAPTTVTVISGRCHAGSGSGQHPTISKTANGVYAITYAASFLDELGETEAVSFEMAHVSLGGSTVGFAQATSIVGPVITVEVRTSAGTLSDISGAVVTVSAQ